MKVNSRIKKAGLITSYTVEQLEELDRCMYGYTDPDTGKHTIASVYFAKNYARIQHATLGDIPFDMYDYQEEMLEMFQNNNKSICLSARQTGKSISSGVFLLWFAIFNPNSTVLIASNKNANAMEMIKRIQYTYECLPHWMKPGVVDGGWNKHELGFDNDSRILSQATSANTGRGLSVTLLFCLGGDTRVTIRNKVDGQVLNVTLAELYQKLLNCDEHTVTISIAEDEI